MHNSGNNYCLNDTLKKAAKIIQDCKEKNHFTSIILLDGQDEKSKTNQKRRTIIEKQEHVE